MDKYEAYDLAVRVINKMNNPIMPTGKQLLTADNEYLCKQLEPIIQAVKTLQLEIVSTDLDEAASRYAREEYNHKNLATLPNRCRGCYAPLIYAFKSGANWQKEQTVKGVNLEEEIEKSLKQHNMLAVGKKDFTDIAKHFFELGLKAQKGE